jgi:predicted DNA-binding transcriptional regulator YafY
MKGTPGSLDIVSFEYVNWKGQRATRRVRPIRLWFGSTAFYPDAQWLLEAFCLDRLESRDFSMGKVENWRHYEKPAG